MPIPRHGKALLAACALLVAGSVPAGAFGAAGYARDGKTCDGWPRAPIGMASGMCAGLVIAPPPAGRPASKRTPHLPRTLLHLPNGDVLVADLGIWDPGRGAVWRLSGKPAKLTPVLQKLDLPHTLAIGPDGQVYLGEMSRIVRFDPAAADPRATLQTVVAGLPDNRLHDNRHPLSSFIFDADGALLVNVGAPSDQCPPDAARACPQAEGPRAQAAIWRYAYLGGGRWSDRPEVFARGLRNSLALARHRSGTLLQAENSIDIADPARPYDEINRLTRGRHYGWPYCVDDNAPAPAWTAAGVACKAYERPVLMLPPHGAPLAMLYYDGAMFPALKDHLLVTLHGYRSVGARIVAYDTDAQGVPIPRPKASYASHVAGKLARRPYASGPAANGLILTPGWNAVAGRRPMGAPVGLAVAADGSIWVADDRNGAILRIAPDRP